MSASPGLAGTLQRDWQKAAQFYARFGITEEQFRHGAPARDTLADEAAPDDIPCIQRIPTWSVLCAR
ncbi:MAG: hypothetical protein WB786_01245 [Thermoplasmata archaeon]